MRVEVSGNESKAVTVRVEVRVHFNDLLPDNITTENTGVHIDQGSASIIFKPLDTIRNAITIA